MPVQPESTASSARYSSASRPIEAALTRIGRSFETTVTSRPSCARFSATARMRESLSPSCSPLGSTDVLEWLSSTRSDAALADGDREVEPLVLDAQLVEVRSAWRAK